MAASVGDGPHQFTMIFDMYVSSTNPVLYMGIWQGNDFVVCAEAKLPLSSAPQWVHETYGFGLAVLTFAIVFGALVLKKALNL